MAPGIIFTILKVLAATAVLPSYKVYIIEPVFAVKSLSLIEIVWLALILYRVSTSTFSHLRIKVMPSSGSSIFSL